MTFVILLLDILSSWAFCKGLKFRSSDKCLGIISLKYFTHMPVSKYKYKYFTTSLRASIIIYYLLYTIIIYYYILLIIY